MTKLKLQLILLASASALSPAAAQARSPTPPTAPSVEVYSSSDTEIGILLDDPAARAVLQRFVPAMIDSPQTKQIRGATLKAIQGYGLSVLTDDLLSRIDRELAKLTPVRRSSLTPANRIRMTTDQAKVRAYTLPDVLRLESGRLVRSARGWWRERRPQIHRSIEAIVFGAAPPRPAAQRFEVFDRGTSALGGKAIRRQVQIHVMQGSAAPQIQIVQYLPAAARKPVPMLLMIGFSSPAAMIDDPGIRKSMVWDPTTKRKVEPPPYPGAKFDVIKWLDAGFGVTTFYYADLEPDFAGGYSYGIRSALGPREEAKRPKDGWGAIAAWAWSLSRVQDYLETDPAVDAKRVAIFGASRLGRAVLWAGANDRRFAAVIACCSGKLGAGLVRRNFGSSVSGGGEAEVSDHWLSPTFRSFWDREDELPFDGHMLVSLIAPRPLLLQTGKYDHAADPKGEFLGAVGAGPVYRLLGAQDLGTSIWPPKGPIFRTLGYTMHDGGHGPAPGDWDIYLAFLQQHLQRGAEVTRPSMGGKQ